ncbi:MAG TPA: hypothetical protein VGE45_12125 [Chloroflexia bacterium]
MILSSRRACSPPQTSGRRFVVTTSTQNEPYPVVAPAPGGFHTGYIPALLRPVPGWWSMVVRHVYESSKHA